MGSPLRLLSSYERSGTKFAFESSSDGVVTLLVEMRDELEAAVSLLLALSITVS